MEQQDNPTTAGDGQAPTASRISFERLRERTDELELLVSGLFAFALLAAPGRVLDAYVRASVHVEETLDNILRFGFQIAVGFCYALAVSFIAHLAIRAYWVGLIGLKSTFPDGIRWDRVPLMGAVTRPWYQRRVGALTDTIDRVDRAASILFAMTTLVALLLAWIGVVSVLVLGFCGLLGSLFVDSGRASLVIFLVLYGAFMAATLVPIVVDRLVARREAAGRPIERLRKLGEGALRVLGWMLPQRLISPVQLTLQSNLPGKRFMVVYAGVGTLAMLVSAVMLLGSYRMALVDDYSVITTDAVDHGMLGAHYESLRDKDDQLLVVPMIPSDRIADTHMRLFIPHRPVRDNPLARERCPALTGGGNAAKGTEATVLARACVAKLWSVSLDGEPVALDAFVPTERRDLGMRGLLGYLEVAGMQPGLHTLHLVWNAEGGDKGALRRREYWIPFWFTPAIDHPAATHALGPGTPGA